MKANYKLPSKQDEAFQDGVEVGFRFGINLATIAFHRTCGIGKKRIKKAEAECQKLLDEIVDVKDSTVNEIIINCNGVSDLFVSSDTADFENSIDIFYFTREEAEQALKERAEK